SLTLKWRWVSSFRRFAFRRARSIDGVTQNIRIADGSQAAHWNFRKIGIGQKFGAVGEGSAHGFDNPVHGLGVIPDLQFNRREDVHFLDDGYSTGTGRRAGDHLPVVAAGFVSGT